MNLSQYHLERLHRGAEFILYRGLRHAKVETGPPSILALAPVMEPPAPATIRKIEHEFSLKDELDPAWAIHPIALTQQQSRTMLVFEDQGAEPLDRVLQRPIELKPFLRCAIGLAAALGQVHRRGLIHKDIKPSNVLANAALDQAWLTGFGISSRMPRERQSAEPPEFISGTLAYMAPEQTGRMNRSIDSRSDLYALGVTLYELLTGSLPFAASDPMEWVHCHIARQPLAPAERSAVVPRSISAIIMKLLAKTPEERYQTASGVESDLRRCLEECGRAGGVRDFALGEHDRPGRLLIPEKLYGREREIETLLGSFERVVRSGRTELVLVSGYSGIGKSSVVNQLHKVLVPPRGLFASGKCERHKRHIPYSTVGQVLQSLTRRLLLKKDAELAIWRDAMREALGPNGRLMVELVPELEMIIGEQPPVSELPPQDARRRFQLVFRRLMGVFARQEHPLALFLDDLQWLDSATLEVLETLLIQADVHHLLIIGAYRDNEVDTGHPLARKLEDLRKVGASINAIELAPLSLTDVAQLVADSLQWEPEAILPLAQSVYDRTAGNPFFTIQFISALEEERLLAFDHAHNRWLWDLDRIRAKGYTENVLDLMVGRLRQLTSSTQKALQQLACLGNAAKVATLSMVYGAVETQVHSDLFEAVRAELVEQQGESYKFTHDRIQEAAYSLVPELLRPEAHLRIGRLLFANTPPQKREEAIFEIVNQLNHGVELISSREEREQLAELNLIAGQRAKAAAAYPSALSYLNSGATFLPTDSWEHRHELTFALDLNRAECEYVAGQLGPAEARLSALAPHARTVVEQAAVACLHMDLYLSIGQFSRAIDVGLDRLRDLGGDWSAHPSDEEVRREYERLASQLETRTVEDLVALPVSSDPVSLATLDILVKLGLPAFALDSNLHALISCRAVNLSVERGNCEASCYAYAWLGALACARFGDYQAGYRFGRIGSELVEQRGWKHFQPATHCVVGSVVIPWVGPFGAARDLLYRSFEGASSVGDVVHTCAFGPHVTTNMLAGGDHLAQVEREARRGLDISLKAQFVLSIEAIRAQLGLVRTLRGLSRRFGCLDTEEFEESTAERRLAGNPGLLNVECWYWIRKLQARFFARAYTDAIESASHAQQLMRSMASGMFFEAAEYHFYSALSRTACCESASGSDRQQHLEIVALHRQQLDVWAQNCPENFENRAALVGAEVARIEGRDSDAMRLYEKAIHSASQNGLVHNEALAWELAAGFYAARGFEEIGYLYLAKARRGYLRWGADGKVRQLDQLHPRLRQEEHAPSATSTIETPVEQLDLATVIEVSQALAGEVVLEKLIDRLMRVALEHAGADRGLLLSPQPERLQIQAEATARGDDVGVHVAEGGAAMAAALPESLIRYATRTREAVILDDASSHNPFSADPYIAECRARSILCLPLINQGELNGVLYLENHLTPHVFTSERLTVLKVLASQAAISLKNSRLYHDLADREGKIRRLVDANIIGIFFWELGGRILDANDAFLTMLGYDREDLVSPGLCWIDLTPPEWRERDERLVPELKMTGALRPFEKEYLRKDGSRVPVLIGVATFEASVNHGVAFVLDLTERKHAEEALREAQHMWRSAIDGIPGLLAILAPNGELENINRRILEYSGQELEELRNWGTNGTIHPEDVRHTVEVFTASIASGVSYEFEARIRRFDGAYRWFAVRGVPVRDVSGRIVRWYSLLTDIEDRTRALARMQQMQADFAHVNRVSLMGELAASLSHEITQPIATARNNARAALNFLEQEPPELSEVREALDCVMSDADRAGGIVDRIRDQIKKVPPRKDHFDLNAAIQDVLGLAGSTVMKYRVSVQTRLADGLLGVQGDRVQLQQVILNLILNAAEALGSMESTSRELLVRTELTEASAVLVAVCDSGPGIDPEHLERVFEPFYTTKASGVGMGLSICRSIIEAHGGRIWAEANKPRGAVFQFTLPGG
jgi:PAS domain S-box-containing protein